MSQNGTTVQLINRMIMLHAYLQISIPSLSWNSTFLSDLLCSHPSASACWMLHPAALLSCDPWTSRQTGILQSQVVTARPWCSASWLPEGASLLRLNELPVYAAPTANHKLLLQSVYNVEVDWSSRVKELKSSTNNLEVGTVMKKYYTDSLINANVYLTLALNNNSLC